MKPTPTWLAEKIRDASRKAQATTCRRCGADVLTGLDGDVAALTVTVDAEPVGPAGELRALMGRHHTYDLISGELHHRSRFHHQAGPRRPVHVDHHCPGGTR